MLAPALKLLNRQGILLLGQQDPHPHQHLLSAHGARYTRGEHGLCRPRRRLGQIALSQPYRQAGIHYPPPPVRRYPPLHPGLQLVRRRPRRHPNPPPPPPPRPPPPP